MITMTTMTATDPFETLRDAVLVPSERTQEERAGDVLRLADLEDKRVPETLLALFRNPEMPLPVRVAAATVIESLRVRPWIPALVAVLRGDEPFEVRETAAYALRLMADDPAAADALVATVHDRRQPTPLSVSAVAALYHEALFAYPEMTEATLNGRILPALAEAVGDPRLPVRAAAVQAFRVLERADEMPEVSLTEAEVAELSELIADPEDPFDIAENGAALLGEAGSAGDEAALAALVALLEDDDLDDIARGAAADELGRLGAPMAVYSLGRLLGDRTATVRLRGAAASALGGIRDREAFDVLRRTAAATGEIAPVRARAALALTHRQDREGPWEADLPGALLPLLGDVLPDVRGAAADGLGDVGGPDALPALERLFDDDASADFLPVTWWRVEDAARDAARRIQARAAPD